MSGWTGQRERQAVKLVAARASGFAFTWLGTYQLVQTKVGWQCKIRISNNCMLIKYPSSKLTLYSKVVNIPYNIENLVYKGTNKLHLEIENGVVWLLAFHSRVWRAWQRAPMYGSSLEVPYLSPAMLFFLFLHTFTISLTFSQLHLYILHCYRQKAIICL